ncbi:MAG TPA: XrtA system polysaccharide deacetylase [Methylomirabilota bacterium]|nr:XrtA system polysaccharide deacetylase [Methylomirabilota bacterium]
MRRPAAPNIMTIDVEDYYQVSAFESVVRFEDWARYESRVERNTGRLLALLAAAGVRATFFVLGWVAERHPQLVRDIQAAGHEVASHGYRHRLVYGMTRDEFREDTARAKAILEDAAGAAVVGYRAASYSIVRESLWALDVLGELGFQYDSSIFPVHHDRYGIPGHARFPHRIQGPAGAGLWELPLSTVRLGRLNLPIAGGGYLRLLPYAVVRWGIRRINEREGQPAIVYVHPWEIDPGQPRLAGPARSVFRHYVNLATTEGKLGRLLRDHRFEPARDALQRLATAAA